MRIAETFVSVQGEGPLAGARTFFVRFYGCDKKCSGWPCDSPQALQWRGTPVPVATTPHQISIKVRESGCRWVCLTGGEPTLFTDDIVALFGYLPVKDGFRFTLETHGENHPELMEVAPFIYTIVVSPKLPSSGDPFPHDPSTLVGFHHDLIRGPVLRERKIAYKFVVGTQDDMDALEPWLKIIHSYGMDPVWIQPVDGLGTRFYSFTQLFNELSARYSEYDWRLTPQLNKLFKMP